MPFEKRKWISLKNEQLFVAREKEMVIDELKRLETLDHGHEVFGMGDTFRKLEIFERKKMDFFLLGKLVFKKIV